jgi:hypothetical protein
MMQTKQQADNDRVEVIGDARMASTRTYLSWSTWASAYAIAEGAVLLRAIPYGDKVQFEFEESAKQYFLEYGTGQAICEVKAIADAYHQVVAAAKTAKNNQR